MAHNNDTKLTLLQKQIEVLYRVGSFMSTLTDLNQLLEQIMQESQQVTDAEASSLALYDEYADEYVFNVVLGEKDSETRNERIKSGEGIIGQVGSTGTSVNIEDAYKSEFFSSRMDEKTGYKTRSILAVPMQRHGKTIGVIEVLNKKSTPCFTDDDRVILEFLAHQAAIAIENSLLYRENINKTQLASLGEGISGAAHCIKNIVGILELGASSIDYALEKNDLDMINDSWTPLQQGCKRISELVMDMLSYAKNRTPEPEPVDISSFIDGIAAMVSPGCIEKNISIVHEAQSDAGTVMIDKNAIHRCMMNFISNAVDALEGRENASIVIRSCKCKEPDATEIRIEDNGAGIPEDTLQNIFDVFYSTKGSRGTGLGLSTTKKIVEEHGGSVTVSSTEGKGTTFSVRLPAQ